MESPRVSPFEDSSFAAQCSAQLCIYFFELTKKRPARNAYLFHPWLRARNRPYQATFHETFQPDFRTWAHTL
jgi:hypothetical protein